MKNITSKNIDFNELENLAKVGGDDYGNTGTETYSVATTIPCSVIVSVTVSALSVSQTASCYAGCPNN